MKRFLTAALLLGSFTLVGCTEENKVTDKKTVETPGGTATQTTEVKTEKTGDQKDGGAPAEAPKTEAAPH